MVKDDPVGSSIIITSEVLELTPAVNKIMPRLVEAILFRLDKWGIRASHRQPDKRAGIFNRAD